MGLRALRGLVGRKTEEAARGLVKIVVRVWGLSFLSLHILSLVSLRQKNTAFLGSQVTGTWRQTPSIGLTSTTRERKASLQLGAGRYSVGRRGWCLHDSGICRTLKLLHRNSSVQRKETRRPSSGSEYQSFRDRTASLPGTDLWLACIGPILRGCFQLPGLTVTGPGVHGENEEQQPSSVLTPAFLSSTGSSCSDAPTPQEYHSSGRVRFPMAFGFSDPHGSIRLNQANDRFPLLHQSSLEGSSAPSAGAGQALGAGLPHLEHTYAQG